MEFSRTNSILFVFVLILLSNSFSQAQSEIDSFKQALKLEVSIEDSLNLLSKIQDLHHRSVHKNYDSLAVYSNLMMQAAQRAKKDSFFCVGAYFYSTAHFYTDTTKFFKYLDIASQKAIAAGHHKMAARYYYRQASRNLNYRNLDKVVIQLKEAQNQLLNDEDNTKLNGADSVILCRIFARRSIAEMKIGQYDLALATAQNLADLADISSNSFIKLEAALTDVEIYRSIWENHLQSSHDTLEDEILNKYGESLKKLISVSELEKDAKYAARGVYGMQRLADLYLVDDREKARQIFYEALELAKKFDLEFGMYHSYIALIDIALENKEYSSVSTLIDSSAIILDKENNNLWNINLDARRLKYYRATGQKSKAKKRYSFLKESIAEINVDFEHENIYTLLYDHSMEENLYEDAIGYQAKLMVIKDSLRAGKMINELAILQGQYDVSKKNEQITLLKQEQSELELKRRNMQLYLIIIGAIAAMIAIGAFFFYKVNNLKKLKTLSDLKSKLLRSQMNPHMTFNLLSTVQSFILNNKPEKASDYLSKFSRFLRKSLEYSDKDFISLSQEILFMEEYLTIEKQRKQHLFDYDITVKPAGYKIDEIVVPPLLIQPLVENATKHAFKNMEMGGKISIVYEIVESRDLLVYSVTDNGSGILMNKKKEHTSFGIKLVKERIMFFNGDKTDVDNFLIIDSKVDGTKITVSMPLKNKNSMQQDKAVN